MVLYDCEHEVIPFDGLSDRSSFPTFSSTRRRNSTNPIIARRLFARLEDSNQDVDEGGAISTQATQHKPRIPSKLGERYKWQVRTKHEYQDPPSEELTQRLKYLGLEPDKPREREKVGSRVTPLGTIEEPIEQHSSNTNRSFSDPEQHTLPEGSFSDLTEAFNISKHISAKGVSLTDELTTPPSPINHNSQPLPRRTKSDQELLSLAARKNWTWPSDTVKEAYSNSTKHLSTNTIQRMIQIGMYVGDEQGIRETVTGRYILLKVGQQKDENVADEEDVVKRHAKQVLERVNSVKEDKLHQERPGTPFADENNEEDYVSARPPAPRKEVRFKLMKEMVKRMVN